MPYLSQADLASLDENQRANLDDTCIPLGVHPDTHDQLVIPNSDRYAGTYILGVQGVGKSGLLENLINHDIAHDQAVTVVDPHGDLTQHVIACLPKDKIAKTYLLDIEDENFPFGVNVFAMPAKSSSVAQAQAIDRVMHSFEVLRDDILTQAYLPRYLRAATIVLFANPGSTLVDMHRLLTDDSFRQHMLKNVADPTVQQFWQSQYDDLSSSARLQRVEPLIGRLESLFMGRSLVRNIVGQRQTSINFRSAIENKEIIFIRLPIKTLSQDARLIGTLLIAQLYATIFSFADMPEDKRPGFSLYVDEFQHFATQDFAEMFTEGRKFGVRVCLAHQYRGQLPDYLRQSTMTARTKVCFQTTPENSREMAHLYVNGEATIEPEDLETRPVDHLIYHTPNSLNVRVFVDTYLYPLRAQREGGKIEIQKPGFQVRHITYWLFGVEAPKDKPQVTNPLLALNRLLHEVMKTGDAGLAIPPEIVYGFSNCGRGFYSSFMYALNKGTLLTDEILYPSNLVVEGANSTQWLRPPESGKEQLYHFLFHLRALMAYLAVNPIGKKSTLSTTDIAHMLTQLPKRAAFVRSGDDVGVIYTLDTLPPVDAATLHKRLYLIRGQTRQKYCSPKDQPGTTMPPRVPVSEPQLSRWEEVS